MRLSTVLNGNHPFRNKNRAAAVYLFSPQDERAQSDVVTEHDLVGGGGGGRNGRDDGGEALCITRAGSGAEVTPVS